MRTPRRRFGTCYLLKYLARVGGSRAELLSEVPEGVAAELAATDAVLVESLVRLSRQLWQRSAAATVRGALEIAASQEFPLFPWVGNS
ncbi:hypothetical protein [Nocardia sp. NPDC047038]|uniref:hypothetical protein n=1 Tax=Nocardia sp. NPDC047038 TaxID=3154338 RepID=UPI0033DB9957